MNDRKARLEALLAASTDPERKKWLEQLVAAAASAQNAAAASAQNAAGAPLQVAA
ncbi:MAG: hypothetical protein JNK82_39745 [Myxococcaceae bacterium]|nr:hypothetical protein [Myxococcaceae bacterium]